MSKKHIIIPITTFLLGILIAHLSFFTIDDVSGYPPSSIQPLTEDEFAKAQLEGKATFSGTTNTQDYRSAINEVLYISCHRENEVCNIAVAELADLISGPELNSYIFDYEINEWSEEGLITATYADGECGTGKLEANIKNRTATMSYSINTEFNQENCTWSSISEPVQLGELKGYGFLHTLKTNIHTAYWNTFYP